jgi:hypothetical protein
VQSVALLADPAKIAPVSGSVRIYRGQRVYL